MFHALIHLDHCSPDYFEPFAIDMNQSDPGFNIEHRALHGFYGSFGDCINLPDGAGNILGAGCGALRQLTHFVRHHRKAASLFTGACRFNRRIQRQQVGLFGDVLDRICDRADFLDG